MQGKVVMITGASRGIGAAAVRAFVAAGAQVAGLARDGAALDALAADVGPGLRPMVCDVGDYGQVANAVAAIGPVDVLINNAGVIAPIGALADTDPAEWGRAVDINLKGVYHATRAVLAGMKAAGGGTIVTVSSGAAHAPVDGWSAYCATKAGAAMLTAALDLEERANGIRAMGLSPGTVATDMQRAIKASGINPVSRLDWADHVPPEWPARALLWMCGPAADAYIGTEIRLRDPAIRRILGLKHD